MSKAFTKEVEGDVGLDDDHLDILSGSAIGGKNYITPHGYAKLKAELFNLIDIERPQLVETVHWAAKNGDRSENGDYIYGKKRLREIDRRIRFLTQRLKIAVVTDPSMHWGNSQIFFGATVTYRSHSGMDKTVIILGIDEVESALGQISWVSPVAKALLKAFKGDEVRLLMPAGYQTVEITEVVYPNPLQ